MSELGGFQDAFARALAGDAAALAPWLPAGAQGRLAVYRNTIAQALVDALLAQFPTVATAAGEAWMRQAALAFGRGHPPAAPALHAYGGAFPAWLEGFGPAAATPWLADLARIDWARRDALFAADARPLSAADIASLAPDAYAQTALDLHPSAAVLWFDTGAPGLWQALQADPPPGEVELAPEPAGMLLVRPALEVLALPLRRGGYAFLQACRAGDSLAAAGAAAFAAEPDLLLGGLFAELIEIGAFACIRGSANPVS